MSTDVAESEAWGGHAAPETLSATMAGTQAAHVQALVQALAMNYSIQPFHVCG